MLIGALTALVAGCETVPDQQPEKVTGTYKVGSPYQVAGIWFYPREQVDYDETGLASWYGPNFNGKKTANGEIFDQTTLSAAHKTLPMPVQVRVTNLENGKQLVLRVNDRGPFVRGRILDVSAEAAGLLGFKAKGTAMVRVEYLGRSELETFYAAKPVTPPEHARVTAAPLRDVDSGDLTPLPGVAVAPPPALPTAVAKTDMLVVTQVPVTSSPEMFVQAGSFQYRENAVRLKKRLENEGHDGRDISIRQASVSGSRYFRVQLGPLVSVVGADTLLDRILAAGHNGAHIVID